MEAAAIRSVWRRILFAIGKLNQKGKKAAASKVKAAAMKKAPAAMKKKAMKAPMKAAMKLGCKYLAAYQ